MFRNLFISPICGALLLSLSACDSKEPGEDAVATVNGYEITSSELNNELVARGIEDLQDQAARRDALEAIINRKLLVGLAEERDLNKTPDFILAEQRSRELLLADAAARWLVAFNQAPDEADVNDRVQSAGSERFFYQVEGVQFPALTDPKLTRAIDQAATFEEIREILSAAEVEARPANVEWDSAGLPSDLVRQLNSLPDEKPFTISRESEMFAGVIRQKHKQTLNRVQSRQLAEASARRESAMHNLSEWLGNARSSAEINYRDSYEPEAEAREGSVARTAK
ncbi:hypothetical protein [uncultured Croceicoccus sp.]|uniref:hypothetical protein n=1 Tax=uncultured Croceicoccus sp. TaxID=1295329 RepID=UPI00344B24A6